MTDFFKQLMFAPVWRMQSLRRTMQMSGRLGWDRLPSTTYVKCIVIKPPLTQYLRSTECGSLADGDHRYPRKEGEKCSCKDGWGGINCNGASFRHSLFLQILRLPRPSHTNIVVCQTDAACKNFPISEVSTLDSDITLNMTCYHNGVTVRQNHQMCNVTS